MISLTLELVVTEEEAMALAQFTKRAGWTECNLVSKSEHETNLMRAALGELQDALDRAGYNPR